VCRQVPSDVTVTCCLRRETRIEVFRAFVMSCSALPPVCFCRPPSQWWICLCCAVMLIMPNRPSYQLGIQTIATLDTRLERLCAPGWASSSSFICLINQLRCCMTLIWDPNHPELLKQRSGAVIISPNDERLSFGSLLYACQYCCPWLQAEWTSNFDISCVL